MSAPRVCLGLFALIAGLSVGASAAADPAPKPFRHTIDDAELQRMRSEKPQAGALFDAAEAQLVAGDLAGAERSLAEAGSADPQSWLVARRHCQVLSELGRKVEAVKACEVALTRSSAMDSRAMSGALMATPRLSPPAEVIRAVREAAAAGRLRDQPFSDAALCDVAYHIGDDAMLNTCVENLQQIAPDNFETQRWQSVRKQAPAWALWLGWGAIALAVLATALHAARSWFRRPSKGGQRIAAVTLLALALAPRAASAQEQATPAPAAAPAGTVAPEHWQLSQFTINHADPESSIPSIEERNKAPLQFGYFLQDLNTEALKAERKGNYETALKYWRAAAKAVPDAAVGFSKSCRVYQILGQRESAISFCSRALSLEGATLEDYLRYAELVTQRPTELSVPEIEDLDAIVKHLQAQSEQAGPAAVVECRLGVKLGDAARLAHCTGILGKLSPKDPNTMTFLWSYALLRKDYGEAKRLAAALEKTSMPKAAVEQLRDATDKATAWWRRPFSDWRYGLGLALGVALIALSLLLLRRRGSRLAAA